MEPADLLLTILSSSLVAAVISGALNGWFGLRSRHNDYQNDYFKLVIARRLEAYEEVEQLITLIKVAVVGDDGKPYHQLFSQDDDHIRAHRIFFAITSKGLWLSDDLYGLVKELDRLFYSESGSGTGKGLIEFGKENYITFAETRTEIERLIVRDMLTLHEVPQFLKGKKPEDGYVAVSRKN